MRTRRKAPCRRLAETTVVGRKERFGCRGVNFAAMNPKLVLKYPAKLIAPVASTSDPKTAVSSARLARATPKSEGRRG
jgi:hypothetical protein